MKPSLKPLLVLTSLATLHVACVETALNPNDRVVLTGKIENEDGSPVTSGELELRRDNNSTCLIPGSFSKIPISPDGTFRKELTGQDTQNGNLARCFSLSAPRQGDGSAVYAEFLMQVENVQVPTLRFWNGAVAASSSGTDTQIAFRDTSSTHGFSGAEFTVNVESGVEKAWVQRATGTPITLSDYVLEDFADLRAYVSTWNRVKGSGTTFTLGYRSKNTPVTSKGKVPVSRGATCLYKDAPTSGCPLVDGKLTTTLLGSEVGEIKLTLPAAKALRRAVLRDFGVVAKPTELVLEGSADGGATWVSLASLKGSGDLPESFQDVPLSTSAPAVSQVRIRGAVQTGTFAINRLAEISLFE